MKKHAKSLNLNRETLRQLTAGAVRAVNGAATELTVCYSQNGNTTCTTPPGFSYGSCHCGTFTRQGGCYED